MAERDPRAELNLFPHWPFRHMTGLPQRWECPPGSPQGFAPAVDVSECDDRYMVAIELPGTEREDVTVELHEGALTIRGEKRRNEERRGEQRRHAERCFGAFARSFSLPANVDAGHIDARLNAGVLRIEIPKQQEAKPRTLDIKG